MCHAETTVLYGNCIITGKELYIRVLSMKRHTELLIIKSKGLAIKHFSTFFALILQNRPIETLNLIYCSQWSDWQFF